MAESKDRRIAFGIFVVVIATYGYFFGGSGWAQNSHFALTRSIVEHGSFEVSPYWHTTGDVANIDGRLYSNKAPGLAFLAVIPYALITQLEIWTGLDPGAPATLTLNLYLCTLLICSLSGAAIPTVLYTHARGDLGMSRRLALGAALAIAMATPLFPWSTVFFLHVPNALTLLLAYVWATRGRPGLSGAAAGGAALLNYLCIPLIAVFGVLAIQSSSRRWRAAAVYMAICALLLMVLATYQVACFGAVFRNPITTNQIFVSGDALFGIVRPPTLEALYGITISPYRGLIFLSPFLLIALAGALRMFQLRGRRLQWLSVAAVVSLFFGFNLTFNNWEGGFGIGPRYLVATVPFLGIWLAFARPRLRWLWLALGVVSLANNFAAAAVDPQPSGSIPRPLTQYIYPLLLKGEFSQTVPLTPPWSSQTIRGHVAVNPHTPDQLKPFMLHPPDSAESQWASFNLGEPFFGAGSPWSLLPVVLWMIGGALWLWREARGDPEGSLASGPLVV